MYACKVLNTFDDCCFVYTALALQQKRIPYRMFEKDPSFEARKQGTILFHCNFGNLLRLIPSIAT
jgi:hypothetical protein